MSQQNMKCRMSELGSDDYASSATHVPASLDGTIGQNQVK